MVSAAQSHLKKDKLKGGTVCITALAMIKLPDQMIVAANASPIPAN